MLKSFYKKTKRGRVLKINQERYLRNDISCGIEKCPLCDELNILTFDNDKKKQIFILDMETVLNQIDLIQNCPVLVNVVIFQTIIEEIKRRKPETYSILKNITETETYRKFFIFANEFFEPTYTSIEGNETVDQRNNRAILNAAVWYSDHLKVSIVDVIFITNSYKNYTIAKNKNLNSLTIHEFIKVYCSDYPTLVDYIGFMDDEMEIEEESQNKKIPIYEEHLDIDVLTQGIKQGDFFQGKLMIDRNNNEEGKIIVNKFNFEIKIKGNSCLNRSMNGDFVSVKLLPQSEWMPKQFADIADHDVDEIEPVEDLIINEEEKDSNIKDLLKMIEIHNLTPLGKVVGIIKRAQRNFCGHLLPINKEIESSINSNNLFEFIPADGRYPHFYIKLRSGNSIINQKIIVGFNKWSNYSDKPEGHFIGLIGEIGNLETESKVILMEHNVEIRNFSQQVLACLPLEDDKWQIPETEIKKRLDLRSFNVVSIDPPGCKDIDDALHCIKLPNGNFELGVHIADVSYFVRPEAPIDLEAAHRCTTVYLVERRTDMLPKLLTENLCSLKSNVDRLAFSVIWEMNQKAEIVKTKFSKTIIRSRMSLTYEEAQKMIDNKNDNSDITNGIRYLNYIAKILKSNRINKGALQLASTQVKFTFDDETHNATDVSFYRLFDTNSLIEEFMLLANVAVAEKIVSHYPSNSVLRKHSTPKMIQIRDFSKLLDKLGYKLDYSTSRTLAESLDEIIKKDDNFFNQLIRIMTTRCMNEANYFCTADVDYPEFHHYGLACSLYTHFTSPIRRYADILVHRLLAAAIDIESLPSTLSNKQKLKKICDKMNMRNRMARFASRASSDYHTYLFFKGKTLTEDGMITNINQTGFFVILPRYGLEGFILFSEQDKKINENLKTNEGEVRIDFYIKNNHHKIFDHILVKISVELKSFHKQISLEYVGPNKAFK